MIAEKKLKILIIDDDDVIRETYVQVFTQNNFEVISGVDGVEGVDLATKELPDIILTGIIMPRMDGFQLINTLRENVQTRDIPIAVLSHLGREEDRKKAEELGISEFIIQGTMNANEIVGKMRNLLKSGGNGYKLICDPYAWDAPKLSKTLTGGRLECPSCLEKLILELTPKLTGKGYDAIIKCPKCNNIY